jgi:hypothetical protein
MSGVIRRSAPAGTKHCRSTRGTVEPPRCQPRSTPPTTTRPGDTDRRAPSWRGDFCGLGRTRRPVSPMLRGRRDEDRQHRTSGRSDGDESPVAHCQRRRIAQVRRREAVAEQVVGVKRTTTLRTHQRTGRNRRWQRPGRGWMGTVTVSAALMTASHTNLFDGRRCSLEGFPHSPAARLNPQGRRSRAPASSLPSPPSQHSDTPPRPASRRVDPEGSRRRRRSQ